MEIRFGITGFSQMDAELRVLGERTRPVIGAALSELGEDIMAESKSKYVPVATGNLRDTGHVGQPMQQGNTTSVTLSYGGPAAPYAVTVHERLDVNHPVGQAKYLERPLMEAAFGTPSAAQQVADYIRKEAWGGTHG